MSADAPNLPRRFADRVVIVTGGGYGIGRGIALAFGREGAHCVLAARSREKLDATADELRAMGTRPAAFPLSVTDESAVADMVRNVRAEYGRIDVLVNNAGIAGPAGLARDLSFDAWQETMEVNLTGAFLCSKHVAPVMIEQKRGSIVNIASVAGRIGYALRSPYAASKWGMIGLSHSLAYELGEHGVRVNAVLPGSTEGERLEHVIRERAKAEGKSIEEASAYYVKESALRRMLTPDEVAAAVTFLASDDAAGITGQALNVDAGLRMQ